MNLQITLVLSFTFLTLSCDKDGTVIHTNGPETSPLFQYATMQFATANNLYFDFVKDTVVFTYDDNQHLIDNTETYETTVINPLAKLVVKDLYNKFYPILKDDKLLTYNIDISTTFRITTIRYLSSGETVTDVFYKDISEYPQW